MRSVGATRCAQPTDPRGRSATPRSRGAVAIAAGQQLLASKTRPTAIFASSDLLAVGLLRAAHEAGLSVPEDLAIVSFDGTQQTEYCWPPLTTIRQPIAEMAEAAVDTVLDPPTASAHQSVPGRSGGATILRLHRIGPTVHGQPRRAGTDQSPPPVRSERPGSDRDRSCQHLCRPAHRRSRARPRHHRRRLPAIAHWGADLGALTEADVADLVRGGVNPVTANLVDEPVTTRRPARALDRLGRTARAQRIAQRRGLVDRSSRVDRGPVERQDRSRPARTQPSVDPQRRSGRGRGRRRRRGAPGWRLTLTVELTVGGLVRAAGRRSPTTARRTSWTTWCSPCRCRRSPARSSTWPVAGARSAPRSAASSPSVSTCARAARAGPGPEAATVLHVGTPGFGFAARRDLGPAHRLERQPHPLRGAAVHR